MTAARLLCPECGAPYEEGDFLCTGCELILDLDAADASYRPNDAGIVRALISPPQRRSGVKPLPPSTARKKNDPEVTARTTVIMDELTIPRLVAGLDLALTPLHEFEAMVASFVDGTNNVPQIAAAAEISRVEAMAVLASLAQRRVLELHRHQPPRPEARPSSPPPSSRSGGTPAPAPAPVPAPAARVDTPFRPERRTPLPTDLPRRMSPVSVPTPPPSSAPPASRTPPSTPSPSSGLRPTPPPAMRDKPSQLQSPTLQGQPPRAENVLERAISLERRGEVDGAIHILKRAITQVKEPAALYNKLALILVNQRKDFKQAEELLNKAIELEPDNTVYQQNLFKIVSLAAERRESGGKDAAGKGFLSRLLKK